MRNTGVRFSLILFSPCRLSHRETRDGLLRAFYHPLLRDVCCLHLDK